jgi:hypothetical protein
MKTIRLTAAEERWLKEALQQDIAAWEEWEDHPEYPLNKGATKELEMLRRLQKDFEERIVKRIK